jgi:hypothetical protein
MEESGNVCKIERDKMTKQNKKSFESKKRF